MDTRSSSAFSRSENFWSTAILILSFVISIFVFYLVYSRVFVFGSIPGNWVYPYFQTIIQVPSWAPVTAILLLGLLIFWGNRSIHTNEIATLVVCFFGACIIQYLIHRAYPISIGSIVESDLANSFYSTAMQYSAWDILARFSTLAPSFALHASTNLPGKILLYKAIMVFTTSPKIIGFLTIVLSTFGAVILYGICKRLFHDKRVAFYAFVLYILIPSKLFFFPILNTITPLFILACFYLFLVYLEKKYFVIPWLLGIALYLLIIFEPSPLVTGIMFVVFLVYALIKKELTQKKFWRLILFTVLAFLITYVVFLAIFSFDLLKAFQYVITDAIDFNSRVDRDYWIWIGENTKEFAYSVGLPVAAIFVFMVIRILWNWKALIYKKSRLTVEGIYVLGLLLTYGVLLFLGINRGEITRLWIYLAILFQIPAALFIAKISKSEIWLFIVASMLAIQSTLTLQWVRFIKP